MIAPSARMSMPLARQAVRRAASQPQSTPTMIRGLQQRMASSGTAEAATEQVKSDAPWAIGSVVIFGSMFLYLTSPPAGGKKGHGDHHAAGHEEEDSTPSDDEDKQAKYGSIKKIEDKPHPDSDAPAGSHSLAERSLTAEDGAHLQKKTKEGSSGRADDITFKKGVAAAKEGHGKGENSHMSDPKKVVAAAHEERQGRSDKAKEEKESADVHNSSEAAQANAHNEKSQQEDDESQEVHNSENAKKANEINEAEGSDKADD